MTATLAAVLIGRDGAAAAGTTRLAQALEEAGIRSVLLGSGDAESPLEAAPLASAGDPAALAAALDALSLRPGSTALVATAGAEAEAGDRVGLAQVVRLGEFAGAAPSGAAFDTEAGANRARDPAELAVDRGRLALRTLRSVPDADPDTMRRLLCGRRPAVFLDYDGVLTPIVADHTRTMLHPPMRAALESLAAACPTAAVSGRDLANLRRLIGIEGMYYAGSHGFEIAAPDGSVWGERGLEFLPDLDAAEAELREALAPVPGHAVERKRFSCAVHYRGVPEAELPALLRAVDAVAAAHPRLARGLGKKVYEFQPRIDWNKGRAVLWLIERLGLGGADVLPIYVGDDITDETAFRALAGRGLGIVVRDSEDRATAADLAVAEQGSVEALLRLLTETASGSAAAR